MNGIARLALLVATFALAAGLGGCLLVAAGAAGVGGYAYATGALTVREETGFERVHEASERAVEALEFRNLVVTKDALESTLECEQGDGTDVRIGLSRETDKVTKISIRVGVFGDEARSLQVLEAIRKELR